MSIMAKTAAAFATRRLPSVFPAVTFIFPFPSGCCRRRDSQAARGRHYSDIIATSITLYSVGLKHNCRWLSPGRRPADATDRPSRRVFQQMCDFFVTERAQRNASQITMLHKSVFRWHGGCSIKKTQINVRATMQLRNRPVQKPAQPALSPTARLWCCSGRSGVCLNCDDE